MQLPLRAADTVAVVQEELAATDTSVVGPRTAADTSVAALHIRPAFAQMVAVTLSLYELVPRPRLLRRRKLTCTMVRSCQMGRRELESGRRRPCPCNRP